MRLQMAHHERGRGGRPVHCLRTTMSVFPGPRFASGSPDWVIHAYLPSRMVVRQRQPVLEAVDCLGCDVAFGNAGPLPVTAPAFSSLHIGLASLCLLARSCSLHKVCELPLKTKDLRNATGATVLPPGFIAGGHSQASRGYPTDALLQHAVIGSWGEHRSSNYASLPYLLTDIETHAALNTGAWSGRAGTALEPLYEAHKRLVLAAGAARRRHLWRCLMAVRQRKYMTGASGGGHDLPRSRASRSPAREHPS